MNEGSDLWPQKSTHDRDRVPTLAWDSDGGSEVREGVVWAANVVFSR